MRRTSELIRYCCSPRSLERVGLYEQEQDYSEMLKLKTDRDGYVIKVIVGMAVATVIMLGQVHTIRAVEPAPSPGPTDPVPKPTDPSPGPTDPTQPKPSPIPPLPPNPNPNPGPMAP